MRHEEILGLVPCLKYGPDRSPGLWLFLLELMFWVVVALVTLALVRFRPALLEKAEFKLHAISQHQTAWLCAFFLIVVTLRLALLPLVPVPVPAVHDEFSYLLGSDTFSHGRLTNRSSPMWRHFESFHVNVQPTYQSMYPPAQGLALALGQRLTGVPWFGVVLSVGVMCSAIYWMLLGWMSRSWAWLGGAFAVARFGIFSYWINSYWGGAVAAIGGALVLGALPRLRQVPKVVTAFTLAIGLLILAYSRPLEGFLFAIPIVLGAAVGAIKHSRIGGWRTIAKTFAPASLLLVVGLAGIPYYNWRGTGNPLLMPYAVNFKTYHISKPFLYQKPNPIPEYRHPAMRTFYVYHELPDLLTVKAEGPGYLSRLKANVYYAFFLWPFLLLIVPALYKMAREPQYRVVLASLGLVALDLFAQIWPAHGHYAAPAAGAVILLSLYSLRNFRTSHPTYGISASRAIVVVFAAWLISPIAQRLIDPFASAEATLQTIPSQIQRERVKADMEARGGKHLVIVHHPYHDVPSQDWIYNNADIDHSHVVWARDMGYLDNKELLEYYPDRQVWYVDRGDSAYRIIPYDQAMASWKLALSPGLFELPSRQEKLPAQQNLKPPQALRLWSVALSSNRQTAH